MKHAPPPVRTSKLGLMSTDRTRATAPQPADTTGNSEYRIKISTFLTAGSATQILYNGDRIWARVTLTLETAGPVAVGEQSSITPVLSGKGQLIETGVPVSFNIAKGNQLYIAATGVNRVKVTIEALPWLETITGLVASVVRAISSMTGQLKP